ncbi:lectin PVL [Crepidotus variabilis]|uniref:Lectin PVL n=1 Tax=Crepidotus variabilis TaxID=179855 RepID=A0A9P6E7V4_9AGAR|nr:lectin PVL [Crepidotus variabilis]
MSIASGGPLPQQDGAYFGPSLSVDIVPNQPIVISQDHPIPTTSPGKADIVGFGMNGVVVLRDMLSIHLRSLDTYGEFGYNRAGWRIDKHVRLLADVTGNGKADIVGFGEEGVWVSHNNGDNTFSMPPKKVLGGFGYSTATGEWRVEKHIRCLADIRNVGRCDIIGFGEKGILVSKNNGDGTFTTPNLALIGFGWDQGWRLDKHLRFLADTTGDGLLDIVGFGETQVYLSLNNGDGTFGPMKSVFATLCHGAGGWRVDSHPRFLADLTGNGLVDIVGCGDQGTYVALNNGNGGFEPSSGRLVVNMFGTAQGWRVEKHPRFVADLTGDKRADIIGFGEAGVYVCFNNGDGTFQPPKLILSDFTVQQGWLVAKHPRFVVDLTGNGCADIVGFGNDAVWASFNDGKGGFGPKTKVIDGFGFNGGEWSLDTTLRYPVNLGTGL